MAFTIVGLGATGPTLIGADAVAVSYPGVRKTSQDWGGDRDKIYLVGFMAAVRPWWRVRSARGWMAG